MHTTDSTLNRQTTARDGVERTTPVPHLWEAKTDIEAFLAGQGGLTDEATLLSLSKPNVGGFSTLALRDRVVIMLLFDQVVREDQVALAWQLWHQMSSNGVKEPLWRVLTLFPDLDRELVYAEAARVYGFDEARISRMHAMELIKEMQARISRELWDKMVELRVMPITEVTQKHSHRKRIVFASPDPTRPEVHQLLPDLGLEGFELRYAREGEIVNLLIEAFPRRYNHLKGLSGVTKDFLAAVYPEDETDYAEDMAGISDPVVLSTNDLTQPVGPSGLAIFEELLVEAVRQGATDMCLLPHPTGQTDVYFQMEGTLRRQRVIEHIAPNMFLKTIKTGIIRKNGEAGEIPKRLIQRWIDDALVRFRVSAVPANEEVHSECIVVRVYA